MGVPILYAGSQYYPGIPPSKQYPAFSAAEVGNVNASTVAVTFSVNISASDYAAGVTIKVNGSAATISSATRQANHAIVYYVLSAAVVNGDTVTWEYSSGSIVNEATGAILQTTSAQSVTNNVAGGDPIGDTLRADALAYWKMDETPNGTRADATGNGRNLPEIDLINLGPVASAAGKIGNCVMAVDNIENIGPAYLDYREDIAMSAEGVTLVLWLKRNEWADPAAGQEMPAMDTSQVGIEVESGYISDEHPNFGTNPNAVFLNYSSDIHPKKYVAIPLAANTFVFYVAWFDRVAQTLNLQANNGAVVSGDSGVLQAYQINRFLVGSSLIMNNTDAVYVDEAGVWNRLLTAEERTYLYNSGTGRALFPAP